MKKIAAIIAVGILAAAMFGCAQNQAEPQPTSSSAVVDEATVEDDAIAETDLATYDDGIISFDYPSDWQSTIDQDANTTEIDAENGNAVDVGIETVPNTAIDASSSEEALDLSIDYMESLIKAHYEKITFGEDEISTVGDGKLVTIPVTYTDTDEARSVYEGTFIMYLEADKVAYVWAGSLTDADEPTKQQIQDLIASITVGQSPINA